MAFGTDTQWRRRFTAVRLGFPRWAADAPDRIAFVSTESGARQVWTADLRTGSRRQVTDTSVGVEQVVVAPDGRIVWWDDRTGDERGRWVASPPDGGLDEPLVPGSRTTVPEGPVPEGPVPEGWSAGLAFAGPPLVTTIAMGVTTHEDYRIYVVPPTGEPRLLWSSPTPLGVGTPYEPGAGGLSADARIVCVQHAEHGDILHRSLRCLAADGSEVLGELTDPGSNLDPVAWSPVPGDQRLVFTSERGPFERPAIWDLATGRRTDLDVDLPGAVIPLGWWPDGSALLARQEHEGRDRLARVDLDAGGATIVADTGGEIPEAAVRPDGTVWLWTSDSVRPPRIETADGRTVIEPPGEPAPPGRRYDPLWFDNPHGQRIQAFVVTPEGDAPFPTIVNVHGGPEWHIRDSYDPETQSLVDSGFAVAHVNYRGSTGYGVAFRRALVGDPWLPETEDVIACLDALVASGLADPERTGFAGWSWGGCLACLNEGLHPDRWKAVFAGIPAGDSVAAHEASMPDIQAYDVAIYGGTPEELPERWRERDPMTFVDRARAPVLVVAGENDPRCPIEGVTPWVEALRERGVEVEVITYGGGHHANAIEQQLVHMEAMLDFFARKLRVR